MSGAVPKRERKKPAIFNPAVFDAEAAEKREKKRGKEKERDNKRKSQEEAFQDLTDNPASLLHKRISVSPSHKGQNSTPPQKAGICVVKAEFPTERGQ